MKHCGCQGERTDIIFQTPDERNPGEDTQSQGLWRTSPSPPSVSVQGLEGLGVTAPQTSTNTSGRRARTLSSHGGHAGPCGGFLWAQWLQAKVPSQVQQTPPLLESTEWPCEDCTEAFTCRQCPQGRVPSLQLHLPPGTQLYAPWGRLRDPSYSYPKEGARENGADWAKKQERKQSGRAHAGSGRPQTSSALSRPETLPTRQPRGRPQAWASQPLSGKPPQIPAELQPARACGGRGSLQTRGPEGRARSAVSSPAKATRLGSGNEGRRPSPLPARGRYRPTGSLTSRDHGFGPRMHKVDFNAGKPGRGGGTVRTPRGRPRRPGCPASAGPGAHYHLQVRPQSDRSGCHALRRRTTRRCRTPSRGRAWAQAMRRAAAASPRGHGAGGWVQGALSQASPSPSHEPWSVI